MRDHHRNCGRACCGAVGCVALILAAGGCMVGPDYTRPSIDVDDSWQSVGDPSVKTDPAEQIDWWKTFNDPILNSLVDEAFAQNLTLREAAVRVIQAMASRGIAVGDLFPQTQEVNGSFDRERFSENLGVGPRYGSTWQAGFDATWELDVWGKFRRNIESADAALDASFASYDDVMVSLVAEVASTYITLRTLQARIRIELDNINIQEQNLQLAETRLRLGESSELDVSDATSVLEQTRAAVPVLRVQLQQAMYQLNFLLGTLPRDLMSRLGDVDEVPVVPSDVAVGIPADLLRRRPDIRVAERQAAAQSAQIGVAKADLLPAFFIGGSLGLASDRGSSLFESDSWTGGYAPGFSWPIFNYGRIKNNVRVQDAAFQAALLSYENTVLSAAKEVESGIVSFLGAKEQVVHLGKSVTSSERSLELSRIRYIEGSSTFTRVLDAQQQLRSVQETLAVQQGEVVQSLIATYKALGGGWEVRRGKELLPEETRDEMEQRTDWSDMLKPGSFNDNDRLGPEHVADEIERPAGAPGVKEK